MPPRLQLVHSRPAKVDIYALTSPGVRRWKRERAFWAAVERWYSGPGPYLLALGFGVAAGCWLAWSAM